MTKYSENRELTVVGGGITGLSAAYFAAKAGATVRIVESSSSFGGLLKSFEVGNNRLEFFYHHFFIHDAEIQWLIDELGLTDRLYYKKTKMGVFKNGRIYQFNSILDLLKFDSFSIIDNLKFALSSFYLGKIADWRKYENITCLDWFYKWAGKNATDLFWKPMLRVKFGPYADKVPLSWMIGRLRQRMNSREKGDEKLGYLKGSLQVLLDALLIELKKMGVELISNSPVTGIEVKNQKLTSISISGHKLESDMFLFTMPGIYLADLLKKDSPRLAKTLFDIKYFGAICCVIELDRSLSNVYWMNVADESSPFGGIIEHTNFVSSDHYENTHILYLSKYFAMEDDISRWTEEQIKHEMLSYLSKIYKNFDFSSIKKTSVFKTNTAATVCELEFSKKIPLCKTEIENLFVVNMSHVYPDERSVNNSIRIAAEACNQMAINTSFLPRNVSLSGQIGFDL